MSATWDFRGRNVMILPSGRLIRGRGLKAADPGGPDPEFALYMLRSEPKNVPWEFRWIPWPDYGLPVDPAAARRAFTEAWERSATQRVEVGCMGGLGRTGTALGCIAVLDGVPARDAVRYVRDNYDARAVETFRQRRFVARFA